MQQASKDIDYNELGTVYEQSLDRYVRKNGGIFYTPKYISDYICKNTIGELCKEKKLKLNFENLTIEKLNIYKNWLLTLKILDPACGSGAFLNQTLDFLIAEHNEIDNIISELTGDKIRMFDTDKQILENNIFGVDINEESVEIAKLSLWLRTAQKGRELSDLSDNIKCGNSLIDDPEVAGEKAFDWNVEFKEIMDKGGFDVVIGNPPYVDSETMTKYNSNARKYISNNYSTAKGNWDLYIPFVEKGFDLIKKSCFVSFITPNKWLSMPYGQGLREFIADYIIQFSDFQKLKVFESADVFPIIFILKKTKSENIEIKIFNNKTQFIQHKLNKKYLELSSFGFLLSEKVPLLLKMKENKTILGQISQINGAFTTSEAYELIPLISQFHEKTNDNYLKLVNTGTIDRFAQRWDYEELTYLKNKYRKPIINVIEFKNKFPKRYEKYNKPKIIISGIRHFESFFDANNEFIAAKSTSVLTELEIYNFESVCCILNSKLMQFYIKESFSTSGMGGGINFSPTLIRSLPIADIDDFSLQKMKHAYEDLQIEYTNANRLIFKFIDVICSDFGITKPTTKIKKWHLLNWNDFVAEIKILAGKFDKRKQLEWIDFFNENQNLVTNNLQKYLQRIVEIDRIVYELYELTAEEIEIVENATQ